MGRRNYRREYVQMYGASSATATARQLINRRRKTCRNLSRQQLGIAGDPRMRTIDVDHKDRNPCNRNPRNMQLLDRAINRSSTRRRQLDKPTPTPHRRKKN